METQSFYSALLRIQPKIVHCWRPMRRTFKTYDENGTGLLSVADFRKVRHCSPWLWRPGAGTRPERPVAWKVQETLHLPTEPRPWPACPLLEDYSLWKLQGVGVCVHACVCMHTQFLFPLRPHYCYCWAPDLLLCPIRVLGMLGQPNSVHVIVIQGGFWSPHLFPDIKKKKRHALSLQRRCAGSCP